MNEVIYKMGELFSGPGGIAYGAIHACVPGQKIIHAWANDFDPDTCKTYIRNICPDSPESVINQDVRKLNFDALSEIDALSFGFPCNDYSVVGKKKGLDGEYGPLYEYGARALEKFKPRWFLAENVKGLQTDKNAFPKIMQRFEECGYDLFPHTYHFEEYGIPQKRHRIIIVGIRKDEHKVFRIPSTEDYQMKSCKKALEEPPISQNAPNNEFTQNTKVVINRLLHIAPGKNAFNSDIPEEFQLKVKGAKLSQIYRRLDPDQPSYTVTGSGGGGTHIYHWAEPRALTNRERARLQTFPDDFIFCGNKEAVRKQIGMAVPCEGAQIIFESILKTFAGIEYKYMASNIPRCW